VVLVMVSVGVMFVTNGIVRLIIGPGEQQFGDGGRFIFSVVEFREWSGSTRGWRCARRSS
jgi:branched-chain amino acid transport system permease protein